MRQITDHFHSYQNCISHRKEDRHPGDSRGGLLSDEMGLGKTLTMISAIVTTLDHARSLQKDDEGQERMIYQSQATLVLVPSAGKESSNGVTMIATESH